MKRMGAGCLLFNKDNQLLLVKPTYKLGWEIPGGIVEKNESPKQCCERELFEELGLQQQVGQLLVVDYSDEAPPKTESLMFIFDGGHLTEADIASIQLPEDELSEFSFFTQETLPETMSASLKARVLVAWQQKRNKHGLYLENQKQI